MKRPPFLLFLCCVVVLAGNLPAQTVPPPAPGPLEEVNRLFLEEYGARVADLTRGHPLYVEVSGNDLILHRNGQAESKRAVPELYHALKNVSHVPFLLYLRLEPLSVSNAEFSDAEIAGLQTLRVKISAARDALATGGFNDVQMKREQGIMDDSLTFLRTTIEAKRISRSTLDEFTRTIAPRLDENVDDASCLAIRGMHAQMMQWKHSMTAEEWGRIVAINPGVIQPRYRNLATQYFGWLFPAPAPPWAYPGENERVIYSEFQHPHRDPDEVLASFSIDAEASTAFFGNKWRLSEDLQSAAAARCIAQLPESDRIWGR